MLFERIPTPRLVLPASKGVNQIACGDRYIAAWRGMPPTPVRSCSESDLIAGAPGPLLTTHISLRAKIRKAVDLNASLSLDKLIDQDGCSDLVLKLGDGSNIHAHRIVLAMRSDKLRAAMVAMASEHVEAGTAALDLPPNVSAQAVRLFLQYVYCDELPSLPVTLFTLHAARRAKRSYETEPSRAHVDGDDVVGQLLLLARLYGTQPLEDLIEKLVTFPHLASSLESTPVSRTLEADILRAFDQPLFSDVTFVVTPPVPLDNGDGDDADNHPQPTEILAHKCLLVPRSEYFRAMFLTGLKEATSRRVPIHVGVRPDVFRRVVRYHYSGVVDDELDPEHVVELFVAGNEFGVDALVRPCERLIEGGLDTDNVADLWHMAATFNSTQLKQLCISFLLKQLRSQASKNVTQLPFDLVEALCARLLAIPETGTVPFARSLSLSFSLDAHMHSLRCVADVRRVRVVMDRML
jgi:hypothetical protein